QSVYRLRALERNRQGGARHRPARLRPCARTKADDARRPGRDIAARSADPAALQYRPPPQSRSLAMDEISRRTLEHYDQRAEEFWRGTRDHDVRQNMDALLKAIEAPPPFTILDFGCGPGRDLKAFA